MPSKRKTLVLPVKDNTNLSKVIHYLVSKRKITRPLINALYNSGKLYADKKNNAIFILLKNKNIVVGAEIHGTNIKPWKGMAFGSNKNLGYFCVGKENSKKITICESAIDAISFIELEPAYMAISTSGVTSNPAWLNLFIDRNFTDRKSTRLNSSHIPLSRMPSSA